MVRPIKHTIRGSPACVPVEWDFEGGADSALDLKAFEVFNSLPRCLNL
jgi:hypothetical protein